VSFGLDKSYAAKGKDMLDLMTLDDAAVVSPHNGNYPLPRTDAFRTVPVMVVVMWGWAAVVPLTCT